MKRENFMKINEFLKNTIKKILLSLKYNNSYVISIQKSCKNFSSDYQINGIIKLSKILNLNAYYLAKKIASKMIFSKIYKSIKASKNGFINISFKSEWLCLQIKKIIFSKHFNIYTSKPNTIVVDYSSPNIAKELHVGHLRSTILGDSMVKILEFLGHKVIRKNHIGDWGTQFGMLLAILSEKPKKSLEKLEILYQLAQKKYNSDENFKKKSQDYVVKLQNKEKESFSLWKKIIKLNIKKNQKIYNELNVSLKKCDIFGESFYNSIIPDIIKDLKNKNLLKNKNGALIIYLDEFKNRKGEKMGVVIKKNDGAFLYSTTDIACLKYRIETLKADRIIYYTDVRQKQHLSQIQSIAHRAGYIPSGIKIEHHSFGMILSKSKKPFQTREGNSVKLKDLMKESIDKVRKLLLKKNKIIKKDIIEKISKDIGIGSIKYFELSKNRIKDYVFNWDQALSLEGNTAPYIQYAYTRIKSILKKSKHINFFSKKKILIISKYERKLIIKILQFPEIISDIEKNGMPHLMCNYLYNLSEIFSSFYEHCPILFAEEKNIRFSRLHLSSLTAKIIKQGLKILGIKTVHIM